MTLNVPFPKTIRELSIIPIEPITAGTGKRSEKLDKLTDAIKEKSTPEKLAEVREIFADRLVKITVTFYLWKGPTHGTKTRYVKDVDNLLKVLLDVLKTGPHRLGLVKEDSFICEVHASKQLVDAEEKQGYRIIIEEHEDEEMLRTLKE